MTEIITFQSWAQDAIELRLEALEVSDLRGNRVDRLALAGPVPVVRLPSGFLDCLSFDSLEHHPAVDPVIRDRIAKGERFRLVRFPVSLRVPENASVDEIHVTVDIESSAVVHSIYPVREEVTAQTTRELSFSPGLTLGPLQVGTGRVGRTVALESATAVTVGFWAEKGADWVLRRPGPNAAGLEGTWEFAVILHWPKEIGPIRATMSTSAVVRTTRLRWLTERVRHDFGPVELRGCQSAA